VREHERLRKLFRAAHAIGAAGLLALAAAMAFSLPARAQGDATPSALAALPDTLRHCLEGEHAVHQMLEGLDELGWSRIPPESEGLDAFAFHVATVTFWGDVRSDASDATWAEALRIHRSRLRREIDRDLGSINAIPFVSDLGGTNYLLLEHSAVEERSASWNCMIVLDAALSLNDRAEAGRLSTIVKQFGRYGEVYEASSVMRAEVGGVRAAEVVIGRVNPELLGNAIGDDRVAARSFYSIYGNTWMLDFMPTD
jgi:hypothetical protein